MFMTIKRLVVVVIFIAISILFYNLEYSYDSSNLESKLSVKLDGRTKIIEEFIIEDKLFIHFDYVGYKGVALLNKGLNDKYRIDDIYYSNKAIVFSSVDIGSDKYLLAFGHNTEKIEVLTVGGLNLNLINKDNLFSVDVSSIEIESINKFNINNEERTYVQIDYGVHTPDTFISHGNKAGGILVTILITLFGCFVAIRLGKVKTKAWKNRGPEQLTGPF